MQQQEQQVKDFFDNHAPNYKQKYTKKEEEKTGPNTSGEVLKSLEPSS